MSTLHFIFKSKSHYLKQINHSLSNVDPTFYIQDKLTWSVLPVGLYP